MNTADQQAWEATITEHTTEKEILSMLKREKGETHLGFLFHRLLASMERAKDLPEKSPYRKANEEWEQYELRGIINAFINRKKYGYITENLQRNVVEVTDLAYDHLPKEHLIKIIRLLAARSSGPTKVDSSNLQEALIALAHMWQQYCPGEEGHLCMGAGEACMDVLKKYNLLKNFNGWGADINFDELDKMEREFYQRSVPTGQPEGCVCYTGFTNTCPYHGGEPTEEQEGFAFYCQREIEDKSVCDTQCEHCKEYYAPCDPLTSSHPISEAQQEGAVDAFDTKNPTKWRCTECLSNIVKGPSLTYSGKFSVSCEKCNGVMERVPYAGEPYRQALGHRSSGRAVQSKPAEAVTDVNNLIGKIYGNAKSPQPLMYMRDNIIRYCEEWIAGRKHSATRQGVYDAMEWVELWAGKLPDEYWQKKHKYLEEIRNKTGQGEQGEEDLNPKPSEEMGLRASIYLYEKLEKQLRERIASLEGEQKWISEAAGMMRRAVEVNEGLNALPSSLLAHMKLLLDCSPALTG
jgi:hypothetical protein